MKYAVDRSLQSGRYTTAHIGPSLKRVLNYWTMRDKFQGIHPVLAEKGFARVEVTEVGQLVYSSNAGTTIKPE